MGEVNIKNNDTFTSPVQTKLYKRRFLILALFSIYSAINAFQWIQYSIITNIISKYYEKSPRQIDWLSMIYMAVYIPFIVPASWLLNARGLKDTAIIGALLNALGAWVKCFSVNPNLFWVTMLGQTLCAVAQLFILNIPSKLAATWFGSKEVATACSIGVFGNQVGVALGFLIPPIIVPNTTIPEIGIGLRRIFYAVAIISTLVLILIVTVYQKQPAHPPSPAQMALHTHDDFKDIRFRHSLLAMFKSRNFILLFTTYGIITGNYYAISTLLNQIVLYYFPNEELNAGRIGLTMIFTGLIGAVLAGLWLDRTKTFKLTTILIYMFTFVFTLIFTFTLRIKHIWIVFVNIGLLGFFMNGYLPVGFEFAAEITYPHSAGISSGLLNAAAQIFGILFTLAMGELIDKTTVFGANIFLAVTLLFGLLLTFMIRSKLKREDVNIRHKQAQEALLTRNKDGHTTANDTAIDANLNNGTKDPFIVSHPNSDPYNSDNNNNNNVTKSLLDYSTLPPPPQILITREDSSPHLAE